MEFKNPRLPNHINISHQHPLKSFLKLFLMAIVLALIIIVLFSMSATYLAKFIPFRYEVALMEKILEKDEEVDDVNDVPSAQQIYLQNLADQLLNYSDVHDDIKITIHYSDRNIVNAFATLGGHIYFYKGLVEKLKTKQALAMVMGHEIAHIINRDPITSLGRGVATSIALSTIFGSDNNAIISRLTSSGEILNSLKYSRDHEIKADEDGFRWINDHFGNGCGAHELFLLFDELNVSKQVKIPQILVTHPYASTRLLHIQDRLDVDCDDPNKDFEPNPFAKKLN